MNTLKERLEHKTIAVLAALDDLAALSSHGEAITPENIEKIRVALEKRLLKTFIALSTGRDAVKFTLKDDQS